MTESSPQNEQSSTPSSQSLQHTPIPQPDVALDTNTGIVYFLPVRTRPSLIFEDVSIHQIPASEQKKRMDTFRSWFLSYTPFVHIPATMTAAELLQKKPCLWLMVMTLSTFDMEEQFRMEETMWHIISRRITCEHEADLDLLQGVVCFGIW